MFGLFRKKKWTPIWHGTDASDSDYASYTIYYCEQKHKVKLECQGYRAKDRSVYHAIALPRLHDFKRSISFLSREDVLEEIKHMSIKTGASKLKDEISDIEERIQKNIEQENYREVSRLKRILEDKLNKD